MKRINTIFLAAAIVFTILSKVRLLATETNAVVSVAIKASVQSTNAPHTGGWYGTGSDGGFGYFNPKLTPEYDPYPYYNILGGEMYGSLYQYDLPDQYESPFNPGAGISRHHVVWPRSGQ